MMKYALIVVVVVLVAGFGLFKYNHINSSGLTSQNPQANNQTVPNQVTDVPNQPVTTDNADSSLQQTDIAVSQASDQMDQDIKSLDQTSSQENDLNGF